MNININMFNIKNSIEINNLYWIAKLKSETYSQKSILEIEKIIKSGYKIKIRK